MKAKNKRKYLRPQISRIKIDNSATIQMMSEDTIPDPPWVSNNTTPVNNPFKEPIT